jgi:hypothetical protein
MSKLFIEPGHFYSPVPSADEAEFAVYRYNQGAGKPIPGIDLQLDQMAERWNAWEASFRSAPFPIEKTKSSRFYYENPFFSYADALVYYAILKEHRPRNVIEIGSGFSSALLLDSIEHLDLETKPIFIEPYPTQLNLLLKEDDPSRAETIISKVQGVDLALFERLGEDDILFIDSSHVAKTGSDLTVELFDILPRLRVGTLIHFHDIFAGFEYPKSWLIDENRGWNECYFVRAFLMNNPSYRILFFNSQFARDRPDLVTKSDTMFKRNTGGSLWLVKTAD